MLFFMNTHVVICSEIFLGSYCLHAWNAIDIGSFIKGWVHNKRLEQPSHKFLRYIYSYIYSFFAFPTLKLVYMLVPPTGFYMVIYIV